MVWECDSPLDVEGSLVANSDLVGVVSLYP